MVLTAFAGAFAILPSAFGAPKPLPELSPEEVQLRALVQPLREGVTEGPELQPLDDWLTARESARQGRRAEQDLRRVLKRIHDDYTKDLFQAARWIQTLQKQRAKLYVEITEDKIGRRRATEQAEELAPVPTAEELWPGREEFSDGFIGGDAGTAHLGGTATETPHDPLAEEAEEDEPRDTLDQHDILGRLTLDLTALRHLLHDCDNEYEQEKKRHKEALEALAKFLQARRAAAAGRTSS
jgi:hypothetical protein